MAAHRILRSRPFRINAIALAVASCVSIAAETALANPTGGTVVSGAAIFNQQGNSLAITNSPGAIINWRAFSIGRNEITRFVQQSSASSVLNRVVGVDPSVILGALQSNGRVFLINPNGILFGAGAQIDVAGLVASTLNLSNADFAAGRLRFTDTPGAGSINNQGTVTTSSGGQVYLIAPDVKNSGIIKSPKGEVILAAGHTVELVDAGTPSLRIEITAPDTQAVNIGQIVANSGKIGIYAGLIRNSGEVRADGVVVGQNGEILLKAAHNTTLDAGSVVSASGAEGGQVTIQSGDTTLVSGTIEAKSSQGAGGTVRLLGNQVVLAGNTTVDASGQTGGGAILVGGDTQGGNRAIQNAQFTTVTSGANLLADAGQTGDGGKVIVWADDTTRFDGHISARGGLGAGNGGFAEISGKQHLALTGYADLRAPNGRAGTLLLDPGTVTICHLSGSCATTQSGLDTFSDDFISTQLGFGNLTITTASASAGPQDINFVDSSININWASGTDLTLLAGNNINQLGRIAGPSGEVDLIATNGNLTLGGSINVGGYAILRATNGAITNNNVAANNVTAQYLEAAAANGINLDTAVMSYVNATNSTSGDISLRNTTSTALVQNIHNAGGNNFLSGLLTDINSTVVTGGVVIHGVLGDIGQIPGASVGRPVPAPDPNRPEYTFTAINPNPIITLNIPRSSTRVTDAYVYLLGAGRTLLAEDDDSAHGYVSVINPPNPAQQSAGYNIATLTPGATYTVVATTFSAGRGGPLRVFDLSIGGAASAAPIPPASPVPPALPPSSPLVQARNTTDASIDRSVQSPIGDDKGTEKVAKDEKSSAKNAKCK